MGGSCLGVIYRRLKGVKNAENRPKTPEIIKKIGENAC